MGYYDDLPEIDINERLEEMELLGKGMIIDVRTPEEYKEGHVPGAINIDSTLCKRSNREYIEGILPDKQARIYMYCESGSRSGIASAVLRQMGYWRAENIGGYMGYEGPVEKEMELKAGIRNKTEVIVTKELTADAWGSGGLPVYATPAMIAMMENTAWASVEACMEEGKTTVGTKLDVAHLSASPVGAHIICETELVEVDGRRLVFSVKASDNAGLIGEGTHERFIISTEKFMLRTAAKLDK